MRARFVGGPLDGQLMELRELGINEITVPVYDEDRIPDFARDESLRPEVRVSTMTYRDTGISMGPTHIFVPSSDMAMIRSHHQLPPQRQLRRPKPASVLATYVCERDHESVSWEGTPYCWMCGREGEEVYRHDPRARNTGDAMMIVSPTQEGM